MLLLPSFVASGTPSATRSLLPGVSLPADTRGLVLLMVVVAALSALAPTRAEADDWKVIRYKGAEYVSDENVRDFYRFERLVADKKDRLFKTQTILMRWRIGSREIYINNIKFNLSYPIQETGGKAILSVIDLAKLIDPVLRPSYIKRPEPFNTVIIDPGHGAHDSGARGIYGHEKNYVLDLSLRLRRNLEKKGFKVVMTRSSDTFLSLTQRVAFANRVDNAIFISIHFNSSGDSSASGIETYALAPAGTASTNGGRPSSASHTGNARDAENIALATAVHAMVMHDVRAIDRGVKYARYNVLRGINKPAILFEGGFVTNPAEGLKIHSDNYLDQLASSITAAVINFQRALGP